MQTKSLIVRVLFAALVVLIFLFLPGRGNFHFILTPKYLFFLIIALTALLFLRLKKVSSPVRITGLVAGFILFGVYLTPLSFFTGTWIPTSLLLVSW